MTKFASVDPVTHIVNGWYDADAFNYDTTGMTEVPEEIWVVRGGGVWQYSGGVFTKVSNYHTPVETKPSP